MIRTRREVSLLLLLVATSFAQERPATGSACVPVAYSDYLVTLTGRMVDTSDKFIDAMPNGYDATESARKMLVAVVANTRAQVSSLGDCQGDTSYRDQVLRLVDFWDGMARGGLATLTGFLADGQITDAESAQVETITTDLSVRGTVIENDVVTAQRGFAGRFGFALEGESAPPPAPAPSYTPPPEPAYTPPAEPVYVEPSRPSPRPLFSGDPKLFLRLHGAIDLDYAFDAGRREDNYVLGLDVPVGDGLSFGALYKHDTVGTREAQRIHASLQYGFGSKARDKVFTYFHFLVQPGVALIDEEDATFGSDFGGELGLGARIGSRLSLSLFYRVDYELWFDKDTAAFESFNTWEVQPGLAMSIGI